MERTSEIDLVAEGSARAAAAGGRAMVTDDHDRPETFPFVSARVPIVPHYARRPKTVYHLGPVRLAGVQKHHAVYADEPAAEALFPGIIRPLSRIG
jgi:hypothetical protein